MSEIGFVLFTDRSRLIAFDAVGVRLCLQGRAVRALLVPACEQIRTSEIARASGLAGQCRYDKHLSAPSSRVARPPQSARKPTCPRSDSSVIDVRFARKEFLPMLQKALSAWTDDYAPSMGAALSYYTLFSLAPLLVTVKAVAGIFFGADAVSGEIFAQRSDLLGDEGARTVEVAA